MRMVTSRLYGKQIRAGWLPSLNSMSLLYMYAQLNTDDDGQLPFPPSYNEERRIGVAFRAV